MKIIVINELIGYAKDVTNSDSKKLSLWLNEDVMAELGVEDNVSTVYYDVYNNWPVNCFDKATAGWARAREFY